MFTDPDSSEPQSDYLEKERLTMIWRFVSQLPSDERVRLCIILGSEFGRNKLFAEVAHHAKFHSLQPTKPVAFLTKHQLAVRRLAIVALTIIAGLLTGRILTVLLDSRSCPSPSAPEFSVPPIEPPLPRVRA